MGPPAPISTKSLPEPVTDGTLSSKLLGLQNSLVSHVKQVCQEPLSPHPPTPTTIIKDPVRPLPVFSPMSSTPPIAADREPGTPGTRRSVTKSENSEPTSGRLGSLSGAYRVVHEPGRFLVDDANTIAESSWEPSLGAKLVSSSNMNVQPNRARSPSPASPLYQSLQDWDMTKEQLRKVHESRRIQAAKERVGQPWPWPPPESSVPLATSGFYPSSPEIRSALGRASFSERCVRWRVYLAERHSRKMKKLWRMTERLHAHTLFQNKVLESELEAAMEASERWATEAEYTAEELSVCQEEQREAHMHAQNKLTVLRQQLELSEKQQRAGLLPYEKETEALRKSLERAELDHAATHAELAEASQREIGYKDQVAMLEERLAAMEKREEATARTNQQRRSSAAQVQEGKTNVAFGGHTTSSSMKSQETTSKSATNKGTNPESKSFETSTKSPTIKGVGPESMSRSSATDRLSKPTATSQRKSVDFGADQRSKPSSQSPSGGGVGPGRAARRSTIDSGDLKDMKEPLSPGSSTGRKIPSARKI